MKMKKDLQAEAHVLDRVMHLLEERSVAQLMSEDDNFADYIADLYSNVSSKSKRLRSTA
jgi:hypothetical protein